NRDDAPIDAPIARSPDRELEDRLEQLDARIANGELRGVDADGNASRASIAVVTRQRDLAAFVESARVGQGERMRRNHEAFDQRTPKLRQPIDVRSGHRPPRSAWACSATSRRSAPNGPPSAAER